MINTLYFKSDQYTILYFKNGDTFVINTNKQDVNITYYIAVTSSRGRKNKSKVMIYRLVGIKMKEKYEYVEDRVLTKKITLPSMVQGLFNYGTQVYMIYESAANTYRNGDGKGYSVYPCDRIIITTTSFIYK